MVGEIAPPSGTVTFLFTDIEGSTRLWEDDPDAMESALAAHDERMRAAIERSRGYVFTTAGDSFAVAFDDAAAAVMAAIEAQLALDDPCADLTIRVRMGLHSGVASVRDGDYFGSEVNRCARLMSAGHGGQILISSATAALVRSDLPGHVELADLGSHRLKDLREADHIFQVQHPDLIADFPEIRTLRSARSNLPVQLTEFVGRETELAEVQGLLDEHRLVTLTGSGGSGKTRLAIQAAAECLDLNSGGTFIVELAAITDPHLIAEEVAWSVGAVAAPDVDFASSIARRLAGQPTLLVLDNCEHLVEEVAVLVYELLRECPSLRILATSQHVLNVAGEAPYRVPSLGVPDNTSRGESSNYDAVRLFSTRAAAAQSGFVVSDDNLNDIVSICRRLDGIPLAIELAAARVRVLTPGQINDRLNERFNLLAESRRDVAQRQRTLRAAMEWSLDLLSEHERVVFRRLGIFPESFTLDAAEAVVSDSSVDRRMVLDLVTALVDKSLITPEHAVDAARYRLQESIREYAREQLERAGEVAPTLAHHAAHYASEAEVWFEARRSGATRDALDQLHLDDDNIRLALRSTLDTGDVVSAARIVAAVGHLWYLDGSFREGIEWCRELFDKDPDLPKETLARVLHVYGTLLGSWSEPEAGAEILRREIELLRELDDPRRLAGALNNLGNLLTDLGQMSEAEKTLTAAIDKFTEAGESATLSLVSLGWGLHQTGRYEDAAERFAEALQVAVRHGDDYEIALAQFGIGRNAVAAGADLDETRHCLTDARNRFEKLAVSPGVAECELGLGHLDRTAGNPAAAAAHLLAALQEPDGLWYVASKFWIIQLAAGMIDDQSIAHQLASAAEAHYARSRAQQPVWVLEDLARTRARLAPLDTGATSLMQQPVGDQAIALARTALERLAVTKNPNLTEGN